MNPVFFIKTSESYRVPLVINRQALYDLPKRIETGWLIVTSDQTLRAMHSCKGDSEIFFLFLISV